MWANEGYNDELDKNFGPNCGGLDNAINKGEKGI